MGQSDHLSAGDMDILRLEQARLLKERVLGSCLLVEFIIAYTAVIMAVVNSGRIAAIWFGSATAMVAVTFLYGRLAAPAGINRRNFESYLAGHRIVSGLTGLVWGAFAIYQLDYASEVTILLGCLTVCSITLGGVFPSSAYRPTYIALATISIPPLGFYIALTAPGALRLVGMGLLAYYLFAMFISARVEIETRETLAARNARTLNEKIVAQNELYLQASEEKSRFLAATSHDLSQPLQSQGFFMKALREHLQPGPQLDLLGKIEESWRAQKDLLQGIVDVSRIDSGAIVPRISNVRLADECEKLVSEFESGVAGAQIGTTNFDDIEVETDPLLLARIIRNLLSNARKFTPPDGTITFKAIKRGNHAEITVTDDGIGILAEDQNRIFEEYVRLGEKHDGTPGLGLGLSIVRRLCSLLKIELSLESRPGHGTSFTLMLPLVASAPHKAAAPIAASDVFDSSPLVVLVDDDASVTEAMATVLTSWKCQLITAGNSAEAMDLIGLTEDNPALLLIDKRLGPDDDGVDLIAAIREECNEQIPAILMSGNLGNLAGYDENDSVIYLNKPIEPGDLRIAMQDILRAASDG